MKFLVDEQLPAALVDWLTQRGGCTATHVRDVGLKAAEDADIRSHCLSTGAVLITKDEDFVSRGDLSGAGLQVIWIRLGNASNDVLVAWLVPRWDETLAAIRAGAVLVELR
jgi:predicted nuclease of predicted toxin-antitoxin system